MIKNKIAAGALLLLSMSLAACGGTTAVPTATVGPESTPTGASTNMGTPETTGAATATTEMATTGAVSPTDTAVTGGGTATAGGGASGGLKRQIVVGSKDFTEEYLIGEMYADVLEDAGVPVTRKLNLGTTAIAQEAIMKGGGADGIDLYPEYTGTGLQAVLQQPANPDPQATYNAVKDAYLSKYNLVWLDMSPMNDTQAVVTTQDVSTSKGIKSLADLCAQASNLTIVARPEFKDRPDALPALQKIYGGCNFKELKAVQSGDLLYKALIDKQADVAQADSTAGEIKGNNLVLLADPKGYGGPYNIAPVVRKDVLDLYPQISDTLNKLSPKITTDVISSLNWEVSGKKRDYQDVAKEWLKQQGLIK